MSFGGKPSDLKAIRSETLYFLGQRICLWEVEQKPGSEVILILKEVLVTVIEIKTGVPGHHSRQPVEAQSLRAICPDGNIYEKHWESWPESQTNDGVSFWSRRRDNVGEKSGDFWTPMEAVYVYGALLGSKGERTKNLRIMDYKSLPILPKGDIEYCWKHDVYTHQKVWCPQCDIESEK